MFPLTGRALGLKFFRGLASPWETLVNTLLRSALLLALFVVLAVTASPQQLGYVGYGPPPSPVNSGTTLGLDRETGVVYGCGDHGCIPQMNANVLNYGADPYGTVDSTNAFLAALAALPKGGTLYIPHGTYKVNPPSSFTPVSGTIIIGDGPYSTTLIYTGPGSAPVWLVNNYVNGTGGQGQFIKFQSFTMLGNSSSTCFSIGTLNTSTAKVQNVTLDNMRVTGCGTGGAIQVNDVWALNISYSDIAFNNGDGISITDPDAVTGMYLWGTRIHNNGGHDINNTGAGTVTQFEQFGGEDTYSSGGTEVVLGNCRDCDFAYVWFEEAGAGSTQNAIDVTGSIQVKIDNLHGNFVNSAVFASATVSYITIENSSVTNGQSQLVNVPSGSTHIDFGQNNRSNVGVSVGNATAQNAIDCPAANSFTLTNSTGLAVNSCSGSDIVTLFANGTKEAFVSNVGNYSGKGMLSMSGSSYSSFQTGTSGTGASNSRNVADAVPVMTDSNLNAGSNGDIHDFSNSTGIVARITQQGALALTPSGTQPTCSATGGTGGTSSEGYFWYTKGTGSTNGSLQVCQNQSGTYSWVTH